MARMNVYLPDDLAEEARSADLNVSGLTQEAVRRALAVTRTDAWLDDLARLASTGVTHKDVTAAIEHAREEFDWLDA